MKVEILEWQVNCHHIILQHLYFTNKTRVLANNRKAMPQKYKLLQVADFICTIELLNIKRNSNTLNSSEKKFFYKSQELKKTFIKAINKKHFEN